MNNAMDWAELKQSFSLRQRFNRDVIWNVASLGILGVAGIAWNIVIGKFEGAAALGVFSKVYACYIFLSQIAVGGVHASVLKDISYNQDDPRKCADITLAGLMITLVLSSLVCLTAYVLRDLAGVVLKNPEVATGLAYAVPGLFFFSLNKILLNVLNGARHMRAFAIFSALRFIFMLAAIVVIVFLDVPSAMLPLSFTISEVLLIVGLIIYVHTRMFPLRIGGDYQSYLRPHISFGARGVLSGVLSDLNTQVDVLMLARFTSDAQVGIYVMASKLAEGFMQLPALLQRNVNPIIGRCFAEGDRTKIEDAARKIRRIVHPGMTIIGLTVAAAFPLIVNFLFPNKSFEGSWPVFCILAVGIVFNAGYAPMGGIFLQGGRPGVQTLLMGCTILSNVLLNLVLIGPMGINGAALATTIAYSLQAVMLLALAKRLFGLTLWR